MNIYVGNLSYDVSDEELGEAFSAFGTVTSARVIRDRYTDRSRGFGFVEMENDPEAEAAIAELNGKPIKGRPVNVNQARPREDRRRAY
jgi:RNA recognition motif-containing protein